ncbi:MAG TPA: FtsX-like permease family protein [Caulobacteraceae bacterium]
MTTPLAFRFAWRELRSGVAGFRIFLACLALGVAAIAAAGSTAEAFRQGLASQAREILGGDVRVAVEQRRFTIPERKGFERMGDVAYAIGVRAMAQSAAGHRRMVELRGVSERYPLAGEVKLSGAEDLAHVFEPEGGAAGAAVEEALLERLGLKIGDVFVIGRSAFVVRAVLESEPDRLGRSFALGPRVLTSLRAVELGGFLDPTLPPPGEVARISLPSGQRTEAAVAELRREFPTSRFDIRERSEAAAGAKRLIDQLEYFLSFIGLASLVAGGLGVAGAVSAYLEQRKESIAVLKALGADGPFVRNVYVAQIGVLAAMGIIIGVVVGAVVPLILGRVAGDKLPVPALFALYPWPLLKAALFGVLAAAAFSLAPLARARSTPPSTLFRQDLTGRLTLGPELIAAGVAALGLAGLAVITAPTPLSAAIMMAGVAASFAALWGLGRGAATLAGRLRRFARGPIRIGLANLAGPHSAARNAAPAIGLGVALLAAVVLIQSSLLAQVSDVAPRTAPAMVFTDIPGERVAEFDEAIRQAFGAPLTEDRYLRAPYARGRIVEIRGRPINLEAIKESERWAFDSDIGLSVLGAEPPNAKVVEGKWWPADYAGPPLVALEVDAARGAAIAVGDTITVAVMGVDLEARVAALREVDWGGFGPAFAIVLDPHSLEGAPLSHVAIAKGTKVQEGAAIRALGDRFPAVNIISVREQLEAALGLFDRLTLAVRGAAAVAALAGLLVLAGAIAAGARARAKEAATLKVLGAERGQILTAYAVEYGAVGLIAGLAGSALGYAAAWPVVVKVFEAEWSVDWAGVATLVIGAMGLAAAGGLAAAQHALARRPAPVLRAE